MTHGPLCQGNVYVMGQPSYTYVLAAGCLGFAGWALVRPTRCAEPVGAALGAVALRTR